MSNHRPNNMQRKAMTLLELPKELRLMIFEFLPISTRHHTLEDPYLNDWMPGATTPSVIILVAKSATVAPLATCRQFYNEYKPVVARNLQILRDEPLRFIADSTSLTALINRNPCIFSQITAMRLDIASGCPDRPATAMKAAMPCLDEMKEMVDPVPYHRFVTKCARYAETRLASPTIVAVRKHPADDLKGLMATMGFASHCIFQHSSTLGPMGWLLHGVDLDEEYNSLYWTCNARIFHDRIKSSNSPFESWVDDPSDEEWERVWEEGEVLAIA